MGSAVELPATSMGPTRLKAKFQEIRDYWANAQRQT